MEILILTVFLSLLLGALFTFLFYRDWNARRFSSAERESLLPLDDEHEGCRPTGKTRTTVAVVTATNEKLNASKLKA